MYKNSLTKTIIVQRKPQTCHRTCKTATSHRKIIRLELSESIHIFFLINSYSSKTTVVTQQATRCLSHLSRIVLKNFTLNSIHFCLLFLGFCMIILFTQFFKNDIILCKTSMTYRVMKYQYNPNKLLSHNSSQPNIQSSPLFL